MSGRAWLLPALPFAAAVVGVLLARAGRRVAALLAVAATAAATVVSVLVLVDAAGDPAKVTERAVLLAPFGPLDVTAATRVDGLAAVVAVMVCVVALLVQIYSTAYLADDDRYAVYAAEVSLFTAAMLLVVVAGDLIALLIGWEVMGICSYLLIGHYRDLPEAPGAAVKAFLVTRVGDVGFLLGVVLLGVSAGSFRIGTVLSRLPDLPRGTVVAAALLLLAGVAGKSAQFPLHTWLPDAMAGPTPISALIHAATMVAAGVYVVARLYPAFAVGRESLAVLGVVASITMVLGGLAALAQDDLKRVLAWSTVSQLAYMMGGLAVGGVTAATFHLLTHAAFKALLFLAAGAVLHGTGTGLLSQLGGLRTRLPVTFWTMTAGLAALVGVPPFAGFWSKESILGAALANAQDDTAGLGHGFPAGGTAPWVGTVVLLAGLLTVLLTAAYATRLWLLAFFGEPRTTMPAHDPPAAMRWPLLVLAVPTVLLGFAGLSGSWLPSWLGGQPLRGIFFFAPLSGATFRPQPEALTPSLDTTAPSLLLAAVGAVAVWWAWRADPAVDPIRRLGRWVTPLREGLYVDAVQDRFVVRPVLRLARSVRRLDESIVDGAVEGTGGGAGRIGAVLSQLESGNVQSYVTGLLAAVVLLGLVAVLV